MHAGLFVQWVAAYSEQNELLTDFLYQRFPPALKTATDAWLATRSLQNPDAPSSPFVIAGKFQSRLIDLAMLILGLLVLLVGLIIALTFPIQLG